MIPHRFVPILFGFLVSGMMSCLVSAVATLRALGWSAEFPGQWMSAWVLSWAVAFPTILVVGPIVRRLLARLSGPPGGGEK